MGSTDGPPRRLNDRAQSARGRLARSREGVDVEVVDGVRGLVAPGEGSGEGRIVDQERREALVGERGGVAARPCEPERAHRRLVEPGEKPGISHGERRLRPRGAVEGDPGEPGRADGVGLTGKPSPVSAGLERRRAPLPADPAESHRRHEVLRHRAQGRDVRRRSRPPLGPRRRPRRTTRTPGFGAVLRRARTPGRASRSRPGPPPASWAPGEAGTVSWWVAITTKSRPGARRTPTTLAPWRPPAWNSCTWTSPTPTSRSCEATYSAAARVRGEPKG